MKKKPFIMVWFHEKNRGIIGGNGFLLEECAAGPFSPVGSH